MKMGLESMDNDEKKSGGMGCLIGIIIILALVAGIVAVFYFNVGGMNEKVLYPTLRKVGLFESMIPDETKTEPYADYTTEMFVTEIESLKDDINGYKGQIKTNNADIETKDKEIERLKVFEDERVKFKEEKDVFDQNVVYNDSAPSLNDYIQYYERMYPENAAKLYKEALGDVQSSQELMTFLKTYESMDSKKSSKILSEMVKTDFDLAVKILKGLKVATRAKILEEMGPDEAARVTKRLAPPNN